MSISRRCPWCGQDHPLIPSKARPGRLVAICSLLGRAYYNCRADFDALIRHCPASPEIEAEITAELAEHQASMREEEE